PCRRGAKPGSIATRRACPRSVPSGWSRSRCQCAVCSYQSPVLDEHFVRVVSAGGGLEHRLVLRPPRSRERLEPHRSATQPATLFRCSVFCSQDLGCIHSGAVCDESLPSTLAPYLTIGTRLV